MMIVPLFLFLKKKRQKKEKLEKECSYPYGSHTPS